jgi:Zn ribbon nucleic-acid-binding protein
MMWQGKRHEMPETHCVNCGHLFDRAACIDSDARPKPGDVTICVECGHLMIFAENLKLRDLAGKEFMEIAADPRIIAVQRARKLAQEEE